MLVLEITESAYCDAPAQLNDTIRSLRQAGRHSAQGLYDAPPMPRQQLKEYLRKRL